MSTHIETVIVGGGQAGLAVSYYLSQKNHPHIVLEQAERVGNAWRNHRWDSFTLNTPNWQSVLPGFVAGRDSRILRKLREQVSVAGELRGRGSGRPSKIFVLRSGRVLRKIGGHIFG